MAKPEAIVLAAGLASRMGRNKMLLPMGDRTVLERVLLSLPSERLARTIVVCNDSRVAALALAHNCEVVHNPRPEQGKSLSIRLGLVAGAAKRAVLFVVGDQPLLTAATFHRLLDTAEQYPQRIIQPRVAGCPANPVLFPADLRPELAALQRDEGGSRVIARHPHRLHQVIFTDDREFTDLDTPEDYRQLTAL